MQLSALRDKIFNKYNSIHGKFLSGEIGSRQGWFNNLCEANYARHIPGGENIRNRLW